MFNYLPYYKEKAGGSMLQVLDDAVQDSWCQGSVNVFTVTFSAKYSFALHEYSYYESRD